jgi:hypothetical protein
VFTHGALLDIQEAMEIDPFATGLRFADLSARALRSILRIVLQRAGASLSLKSAGEMLRLDTIGSIRATLAAAWRDSMPEPEEDPPKESEGSPMTWMRAWSIARYDLGLNDEEWLAMTPQMQHALALRRLEHRREMELMCGIITAHVVNFSQCHPKDRVIPKDFMLHPWPEPPLPPVTGEMLMAVFAGFPKTKG